MASFRLALREGAPGIELDARLTRDGKLVVFHDLTLNRTTNGHGRLAEKIASELRELDAGIRFAPQFAGERIPFLAEALEALGGKALINIHLGGILRAGSELVAKACALVQHRALQTSTLFSSFHPPDLWDAARLLPEVPRGLLAGKGWKGLWARSFGFAFGRYQALHPHVSDLDPPMVRRAHRLGRSVNVWTVNDSSQIRRLAGWGVDGIITDDPQMALQALGSNR